MTTQTRPDVDLLESLDFEPVCSVGEEGTRYERCENAARWFAIRVCCGLVSLICDPHKDFILDQPVRNWVCTKCDAKFVSRLREAYSSIERIR